MAAMKKLVEALSQFMNLIYLYDEFMRVPAGIGVPFTSLMIP